MPDENFPILQIIRQVAPKIGHRYTATRKDTEVITGVLRDISVRWLKEAPQGTGYIALEVSHGSMRVCVWENLVSLVELAECPFTFAHTKHWCGNEGCREG